MHMLNDCIVANRMPSRVSEIRVDQAYSGYHRRVLSIGEIKCETRCDVVVNQVGDVYRSVRSERFVMLFDGRYFVGEVDMMLKGGVDIVMWGGFRIGFRQPGVRRLQQPRGHQVVSCRWRLVGVKAVRM